MNINAITQFFAEKQGAAACRFCESGHSLRISRDGDALYTLSEVSYSADGVHYESYITGDLNACINYVVRDIMC